jgi:hypothetical protein
MDAVMKPQPESTTAWGARDSGIFAGMDAFMQGTKAKKHKRAKQIKYGDADERGIKSALKGVDRVDDMRKAQFHQEMQSGEHWLAQQKAAKKKSEAQKAQVQEQQFLKGQALVRAQKEQMARQEEAKKVAADQQVAIGQERIAAQKKHKEELAKTKTEKAAQGKLAAKKAAAKKKHLEEMAKATAEARVVAEKKRLAEIAKVKAEAVAEAKSALAPFVQAAFNTAVIVKKNQEDLAKIRSESMPQKDVIKFPRLSKEIKH